jgi:DNA-binding transcriptional LysR family regulator
MRVLLLVVVAVAAFDPRHHAPGPLMEEGGASTEAGCRRPRSTATSRCSASTDRARSRRDRAIVLDRVVRGERCDLRLVSRPMVHGTERFVALWSERFVVALPATHPLALRPTLRAVDLVGEKLVERCHCEYARRFARGRPRVQPVAIARSEEWALALVAAGIGLAIVPEGSARSDPRVAVRTLADVAVSREVGIAYRARSARASEIDAIATQLRRRFGPARIARTA